MRPAGICGLIGQNLDRNRRLQARQLIQNKQAVIMAAFENPQSNGMRAEETGEPNPLHFGGESMLLIASLVLAIVPLLGIAYIFAQGSFDTVDNLFYALILLAMSGVMAANAVAEWRRRQRVARAGLVPARRAELAASAAGTVPERGLVGG